MLHRALLLLNNSYKDNQVNADSTIKKRVHTCNLLVFNQLMHFMFNESCDW